MKRDILLVIDMQNVYSKGGAWYCPNIGEATSNIIELLEGSDSNKIQDVIFTKYIASREPVGAWKQYNEAFSDINKNDYANQIIDELKMYTDKYDTFIKSTYSSLTIGEVDNRVNRVIDTGRVVVSGVVAECCVLSTVMELIDKGASVVYLTDAVAGISKETEEAVVKVLEGLAPIHIKICTTKEYLEEDNNDD